MAMRVLALLCILSVVGGDKVLGSENRKVVKLLADLKNEVEREGSVEKKQFERYDDFCKKQKDAKEYSISKSTKKIESLTTSNGALKADFEQLDEEVEELTTKIEKLDTDMEKATTERKDEHDKYMVEWTDMDDAIKAIYYATKELEARQGKLEGTVSEALPQLSAVASKVLDSVSRHNIPGVTAEHVAGLAAAAQLPPQPKGGEAAEYEYKSRGVLNMMRDLRNTFKENRANLEEDESISKNTYDKNMQSWTYTKKLSTKEKTEKKAKSLEKKAKHSDQEGMIEKETDAKNADSAFLEELTTDCKTKADQYEQRSTERKKELTALGEALDKLKENLSGLKTFIQAKASPSFLQLSSEPKKAMALEQAKTSLSSRDKALAALDKAAEKYGRAQYGVLELKIKTLAKEGDTSTIDLIKSLLTDLETQGENDVKKQEYCTTEIEKETALRLAKYSEYSNLKAEEEEQKTESKRRFEEMVDLKKEIAANAVTLEEATKNRAAEKAENEVTLAETKGSIKGCTLALEILNKYYDSVALVQVKEEPAADRDGKTLKDHAPSYTTEAKDYAGSSGAEKVLGAIEDLQKELEATESEVTNDESQAVTDFEKLKEDTNADTDAKEKAHTEAETIRNECEARIVTIQDDKADAQKEVRLCEQRLANLQGECDLDWATREATREASKADLEGVLNTLEDLR